jgi:hypothetical protein
MPTSHGKEVLDDLAPLTRDLRKAVPAVYDGFRALHGAAFAGGTALEVKHKERKPPVKPLANPTDRTSTPRVKPRCLSMT